MLCSLFLHLSSGALVEVGLSPTSILFKQSAQGVLITLQSLGVGKVILPPGLVGAVGVPGDPGAGGADGGGVVEGDTAGLESLGGNEGGVGISLKQTSLHG
jgi:hypothetical protein